MGVSLPTAVLGLLLATVPRGVANKVQQVHLSLADEPTSIVVTWINMHPLDNLTPFVAYGTFSGQLTNTAKATTTEWLDSGNKKKARYTHTATLKNLVAGQRYYYSVGSSDEMSATFSFVQLDPTRALRAAVLGDMSVLNGFSIQPLIDSAKNGDIDIVFHIGDMAYDLDDKDGDNGDDYMNAIQPLTTTVPYMVLPGNHDDKHDYLHYKNRFAMPSGGDEGGRFWSIDVAGGAVHIISLNTEFNADNETKGATAQFDWLVADLAATKQNAKNAWVVVFMHRPMYCSNDSKKGCHKAENIVTREGAPGLPGLEKTFKKYGVDMVLYAHIHTYERMWPIYKDVPLVTSDPNNIHNAEAPIYILTGSGGCHDHIYPNDTIAQPFSISRLGNYGYSLLTFHNQTHMAGDFIDADTRSGLDPFVLSKKPKSQASKTEIQTLIENAADVSPKFRRVKVQPYLVE